MKTSIEKLLEENHIDKRETVYLNVKERVNSFPITAGNFFCPVREEKWRANSWIWMKYQLLLEEKRKNRVYQGLARQREQIREEIGNIKSKDPKGYEHMEQLRALRSVKRHLTEVMDDLSRYYGEEARQELKDDLGILDMMFFSYKNTVSVGSFEDLAMQIPVFADMEHSWVRNTPLLLGNVPGIRRAIEERLPIGLVGGPCLFGTYEVEIQVRHKDGQNFFYDFSSGHHYDHTGHEELDFAGHVERYMKEIQDITFRNWKKGVTAQEYDSLEILFVFGRLLGARVAIPIPDISYLKYLWTVIEPLDEDLKHRAIEAFRTETRKIADMYLNLIEKMKKQYPDVEIAVLHERNEEICHLFHEKREQYFTKSGLIRRLTAKRQKTDAIFDYISMLALPFYLWETPQVIQIDNLDETDSYRKCRKIHKGAFDLSAILYPERLSSNGMDTIFNAPLKYKEYMT